MRPPLKNASHQSLQKRMRLLRFQSRSKMFTGDVGAQIVDDEGFLPNVDPKLAFAKMNPDLFPIDLNTATYHEIVRIPQIGPITAKKIIETRKNVKIRYVANLERVIGANLARRVSQYVELKDKRLRDFSKSK